MFPSPGGNQGGPIEVKSGELGGFAEGETIMSLYTLFLILCAVLGALVIVAVIGLAKAYRDERTLPLGGHW